jgi:hypothetical protein
MSRSNGAPAGKFIEEGILNDWLATAGATFVKPTVPVVFLMLPENPSVPV